MKLSSALIAVMLFAFMPGSSLAQAPPSKGPSHKIVTIAAGENHSLALMDDGTVWAWGDNTNGQIGNLEDEYSSAPSPLKVPNLQDAVWIFAKRNNSFCIKKDGTVWAWGEQFGKTPRAVSALSNSTSASSPTTLQREGQLVSISFQKIDCQISSKSDFKALSFGNDFVVALNNDGTVWSCGKNDFGQLGWGKNKGSNVPVQSVGLSDIVIIDAGNSYGMALKKDGTVWSWGSGPLGQQADNDNVKSPLQIPKLTHIASIYAGGANAYALQEDGTVWAWGPSGQALGNPEKGISNIPVKVSKIASVSAVAAGGFHCLALQKDGSLWSWGLNYYGQLGIGDKPFTEMSGSPIKVIFP